MAEPVTVGLLVVLVDEGISNGKIFKPLIELVKVSERLSKASQVRDVVHLTRVNSCGCGS